MMGLLPWRDLQAQHQTFLFKITTHGYVPFMSWVYYFKAIYMDYPSGNPDPVQGSILVTRHCIQDQYLWF